MKKKLLAVLAAVMTVVSSLGTAMAAPSPTNTVSVTGGATITVNGQRVTVTAEQLEEATTITAVSSAVEAIFADMNDEAALEEALGEEIAAQVEGMAVAQLFDLSLDMEFDSVTLTLQVSGVSAGDTVKVLHQKHSGAWELITPDSVANGSITVTFTELSPVAILVDKASGGTSGGGTSGSGTSGSGTSGSGTKKPGTTSPKTGTDMTPIAIAAVAFAGLAVFARKRAKA